jgi:hypothetical protein
MMEGSQSTTGFFRMSEGGPFHDMLTRQQWLSTPKKRVVFFLCLVWLPLMIISLFENTLIGGVEMPFLHDVSMQVRLLVALPILILMSHTVDKMINEVTTGLSNELLTAGDRDLMLNSVYTKAKQLLHSSLSEIIMLVIIIGSTAGMVKSGVFSGLGNAATSWMTAVIDGEKSMSIAGYWSVFVTIPIVQFYLLRWFWRYFVWVFLLFRFSKCDLRLLPTHADKSGGLGIVLLAQRNFSMFFVAIGVILSGQLVADLIMDPDSFNTIRSEVVGFILLCILLLLFPLSFFSKSLYKTKSEGLLRLSTLSTDLSRKFEREWVNDQPVDHILEKREIDPSLIYDYAGMYNSVEELRVVPVTLQAIISLGLLLFLPFTPLLFIHFSIGELMQKIAGIVM